MTSNQKALAAAQTTETPAKTENELAREWVTTMGISDGENPDAACTRQQVWTMLYRALGI